ncbi:Fc receptor-like protein 3 [Lepus europaeus]|uniref:Fc receptor-like protein 3 n=1 Tax=Lepus europaeus TaxID=9983 RepID=UPI002B479E60|nr:Fc receptor-like protein 3 [Lepus europaeus]
MFLWLLLLILAPGREQLGTPPKAALLLDPPWSTTFKGNKVILICKDFHSPAWRDVFWYHDGNVWKTESNKIQTEHSGYYQCKTQGSSLSDPVHVEFSDDWLILQVSHPVFEGDDVVLRCQGKEEEKTSEKAYYKNFKRLPDNNNPDCITLNSVSRDSGKYYCTASRKILGILWPKTSTPLNIQVQELFPQPVLTASPTQPIEGGLMTLTCETQVHPQKSDVQLHFHFYRDDQGLQPGWSSSPDFQIPTTRKEDSGSYWCKAKTINNSIIKKSPRLQIRVQRIPVSEVNLEIRPHGGNLTEGEDMVLICSVTKGTGAVTFSWHRDGTVSLGRKTQHSLLAELQVPAVKEYHAGRYYCAADNNHVPVLSKWITVTVRIPVSRPVLTFRASGARTVVGDVVELHCEALRGSPPILYRFYHENVTLGNSSAPTGGGAAFNLSLTAAHSGNYSCEADNGVGTERSHRVSLTVLVPVSRPVLTLVVPGAWAVVGDVVELHCEALRGSPPILYRFYHEDVTLGNSSAHTGGGATFNLSLTPEHSGNYSCEADNGLGAQRSEVVSLSISGASKSRLGLIMAGASGALIVGLATAAALLLHLRTQRRSGGPSAPGTSSYNPNKCQEPSFFSTSNIHPQELSYSEPPAMMEFQPVYNDPRDSDLVYSQIWITQNAYKNPADSPRMPHQVTEPTVIYSELKAHTDDCAEKSSRRGSAHEDATDNYENVPCASAALRH